ncbi:MAG: RNA methyltransferase [Odoribacter sp.]
MNTLPVQFEEQMKKILSNEADKFFQSLQTESPVSIRLNPGKVKSINEIFTDQQIIPINWCKNAYYLNNRPIFTLDPYFHGGAYYVQEASSMFLHHILKQIMPDKPLKVLDLCAAPGGKSTLIASHLPPDSLLVSNEVIRSRASILKENIIKWGQDNIIVTGNDPADFRKLEGAFDIIIVDAPCSGEGLFRKDPDAINEWSENNLRLCSERQQRILSDIWGSLKPGGFLIYSTCTYNRGENEKILEWLQHQFDVHSVQIEHPFNAITTADSTMHCYHFYPHKTIGEGFFIGVVQKQDGKEFTFRKNKKQGNTPTLSLSSDVRKFILQPEKYAAYQTENIIGVLPSRYVDFIAQLDDTLRILYKGCEIAETYNHKLKLLPASALWQGLNKTNCTLYEVDRTTALTFLKKEDIPPTGAIGDWLLISYQHIALGWCKNLGNRLNNYYPKEWRIRMKINN